EAALALHGFGAPWILLRDGLEQSGAGEVTEDEQVERGGEVGQVGLLPRAAALGEHAHPLLVERLQQPGEGAREIATILQDGALDQAREVRVLREIDHEAIDERLAVSLQPGRRRGLRQEAEDGLDAAREDRLVERALVTEVVVEARLVPQAG